MNIVKDESVGVGFPCEQKYRMDMNAIVLHSNAVSRNTESVIP